MILGSCCILDLYSVVVHKEHLKREEEWLFGTEGQLFYSRCDNAENTESQKPWFLIDGQLIIVLQMKRQFKNRNDLNLLQYPKMALYE